MYLKCGPYFTEEGIVVISISADQDQKACLFAFTSTAVICTSLGERVLTSYALFSI